MNIRFTLTDKDGREFKTEQSGSNDFAQVKVPYDFTDFTLDINLSAQTEETIDGMVHGIGRIELDLPSHKMAF